MDNLKYDVVVIGAGVAGLTTSLKLASHGWRVALVESKPANKIGDKVCGDAIGAHHFEEVDIHPPSSVIDHIYNGVKIYSPSREHSITVPGGGVSLNRLAFGQWLLKQALNNGVELYDQHVLIDVSLKDDYVKTIHVKKVGGGKKYIEAEAFIDASGYKPAIRSRLPETWPISERPYTTDYNLAYREVIEVSKEIMKDEDKDYALIYIDVNIAPGGYWWLFPKNKTGDIINVGLGVINNGVNNPRLNYERYLRPLFKGKIIHTGGGIVPTRRPLPTLVWRNVIVVGDAAYTVNPVHGGGIGSSMLSAAIASRYLSKALEMGFVNENTLWEVNIEFMNKYGAKQAGLDILRMYMQKLSNEDYEWIMEKKSIDGRSVYDLGVQGNLAERVAHEISSLIKLLGRPTLLNELRFVRSYMSKARELYSSEYPKHPSDLPRWIKRVEELFTEFIARVGFNRGSVVKW
ncbi:MAG: NAD(P)/FAD-dependent oxidoreductase [Desulfurococcaceae archaeon]